MVKRAVRGIRAGQELYRKLPRSQKAACFAALAALVILAGTAFLAQGPEHRVLITDEGAGGAGTLQRLASALEASSIPWKERTLASGARALEVPDGEPYALALGILAREDLATPREKAQEASDSPSSIFESPERLEARLRDANRRKIEQAILWNPNIRTATIVICPARRAQLWRGKESGDSAGVALSLKRGVSGLSREEADSIRELVRGAFGIPPERISISDNHFQRYETSPEKAAIARVEEKEDRWRRLIKEDIQRMFLMSFNEKEFYVGVMVSLSPQRSSIEKKEVDRENSITLETRSEFEKGIESVTGGILTDDPRPITVKETTQSIPLDSYEKTTIDIPPGELKGVSVLVHLDLAAVERVEADRRPSEARGTSPAAVPSVAEREEMVRRHGTRQEESLRSFLGVLVENVSVAVMVHSFARSPEPSALIAAQAVDAEGSSLASGGPHPRGGGHWLGRSWKPLLLAGVLLGAGFFLVRAVSHRSGAIPASAGGHTGAGDASYGLPLADGKNERGRTPRSLGGILPEGLLGNVGDVGGLVAERPEVAASVLRLWLSHDSDEGAART